MSKIIAVFFSALLFTTPTMADAWFGLFTTDRIPADNCSIINATGAYTLTSWVTGPDETNRDGAWGQKVSVAVAESEASLVETAKKEGWHAVVGYRLIVSQTYNGFGSSIINNMKGVGGAVIIVQGVPVHVQCK